MRGARQCCTECCDIDGTAIVNGITIELPSEQAAVVVPDQCLCAQVQMRKSTETCRRTFLFDTVRFWGVFSNGVVSSSLMVSDDGSERC